METVPIIIKPETLQRGKQFEVLQRYVDANLLVSELYQANIPAQSFRNVCTIVPPFNRAEFPNEKQKVYSAIFAQITGHDARKKIKQLTGEYTCPLKNFAGTIRADFSSDSQARALKEGRTIDDVVYYPEDDASAQELRSFWINKLLTPRFNNFLYPKTTQESTLVLIKPDAFISGVAFRVLSRLQDTGALCTGLYSTRIPEAKAREHYADSIRRLGEDIGASIVEYITSGDVIVSSFSGNDVVRKVRSLSGESWDPSVCSPGTIRFDFSLDDKRLADREDRATKNIIHSSDSVASASDELQVWFNEQTHKLIFYGMKNDR